MNRNQFAVELQERKQMEQGLHVASLCRVEKFDPTKMTVDVQPLSKELDAGVYRTPPQVLGVPVALIRGGGFVCRPWYAAGDVGILLYADHDIDRIAEAGQECQPNTERNHAEEDAIFIGAFVPASKPVTGLPESALVLGTDTGSVYIAVTAGGIQIKGDVTVDGKLAVGGVEMTTHTHPGDSGGTTGGPQ